MEMKEFNILCMNIIDNEYSEDKNNELLGTDGKNWMNVKDKEASLDLVLSIYSTVEWRFL